MKKIKLLLVIFIFLPLLSGCRLIISILDQSSVDEFGDVHFYESELIGSIDWLVYNDEIYYYVSSYEGDAELGDKLGAFNTNSLGDRHGYTLYSFKDESYNGFYVLIEKNALGNTEWLYVSKDACDIPTSFLYDIPHIDDFFSSGQNFNVNGNTYSSFGSTKAVNEIEIGNEAGKNGNITYYEIVGYPKWICSINEADSNYIDISYDITITSVPAKFVYLTKQIIE